MGFETDYTVNKFSETMIRKETISDQIANQIVDMVEQNHLAPGERLPSERELAATLHVSRLPVREALKSLSSLKVLNATQTGYYVNSNSVFNLVSALDYDNIPKREGLLHDLRETRLIIEVGAVRAACLRYTDAQFQEILDAQQEIKQCDKTKAGPYAAASLRFHNAIINASNNEILIAVNNCLQEALYRSRTDRINEQRIPELSIAEHEEIIRALRERDEMGAADAMERHLRRLYSYVSETT